MAELPLKLGAYGATVARIQEFLGQQGVALPSSELDRVVSIDVVCVGPSYLLLRWVGKYIAQEGVALILAQRIAQRLGDSSWRSR